VLRRLSSLLFPNDDRTLVGFVRSYLRGVFGQGDASILMLLMFFLFLFQTELDRF
jgi:hypothetical protein